MTLPSHAAIALNKRVREFCRELRITFYDDPNLVAPETSNESAYVGEKPCTDVRIQPIQLPSDARSVSAVRLQGMLRQLKRWIALQNIHLVQFQGLYLSPWHEPQIAFMSEVPLYGTVMHYIATNPECNRLSFLQDTLMGLDYLHRNNFVHGNIRGDNVFVRADGTCCLGEFSPTMEPTPDRLSESECWLAPEHFDIALMRKALIDGYRSYSGEYTRASDIFAVGCLAVQIYTGEPPEPQRFPPHVRTHRDIWKLSRTPSSREEICIPSAYWPVVATMLRYNPKDRKGTSHFLDAFKHSNPAVALRTLADVPPICAKSQARRLIRAGI